MVPRSSRWIDALPRRETFEIEVDRRERRLERRVLRAILEAQLPLLDQDVADVEQEGFGLLFLGLLGRGGVVLGDQRPQVERPLRVDDRGDDGFDELDLLEGQHAAETGHERDVRRERAELDHRALPARVRERHVVQLQP